MALSKPSGMLMHPWHEVGLGKKKKENEKKETVPSCFSFSSSFCFFVIIYDFYFL